MVEIVGTENSTISGRLFLVSSERGIDPTQCRLILESFRSYPLSLDALIRGLQNSSIGKSHIDEIISSLSQTSDADLATIISTMQ